MMKRLTVVASCLVLTLTGCAFDGLNSLPLPGAVGRGSDAVTYHVLSHKQGNRKSE